MPAPRLPWIKFWPELVDHAKFVDLSDAERWTWIEVWAKASQQPKRWQFASMAHAVKVTGRPAKHIERLVAVGLIDKAGDCLVIHDAKQWQDASNITATQREAPANGDGSMTEHSSKGDGTLTNGPPKGDLEGEGDRERDVDVEKDEVPQAPTGLPPAAKAKNGYLKTPTKSAAVIDAFRASDVWGNGGHEPVLSARDHAAIKHSNAKPEEIVEVYAAVALGQYGDDFMRRRLSVHEAIEWINGYQEHQAEMAWKNGKG